MQIVSRDAVLYAVPVDDIDYPGTSTRNMAYENLYSTDFSEYTDVHDAIPPSTKSTTNYDDDDENQYLNPVDTAPTSNSDANFYASFELNSKPLQDMASKYDNEHQQLYEAVAGSSSEHQYLKDATPGQAFCNSLYATTDLSKPNNAIVNTSKQAIEQQYKKDATNEPASCNSLYATTDLSSKEYQDKLNPNPHLNDATGVAPFYSNLYASTDLKFLQEKATNEGLEQDRIFSRKEDKPDDCQIEASSNGKKKSRHPSTGTIISTSRKTQDAPSIPTPYQHPTQDTSMYAMVDLLNDDKDVNVVYAQVDKKHKK